MSILDDWGRKVEEVSQTAVKKTKEMSEISRINLLIQQEESKINEVYRRIGKMYVDLHRDDSEKQFEESVKNAVAIEKAIQEYKQQIQDVKGIQRCERCGADIQKGAAYCCSCGSPVSKMEEQENMNDYVECASCGAVMKKGVNYCIACGKPIKQFANTENENISISAKIEEEMVEKKVQEDICPNCKMKIIGESVYCTGCGTKL